VNALRGSRPKRMDGVTLGRSAHEVILYGPVEDQVHYLNATAAAIWELCDGETEDSEMVAAICLLTGMLPDIVREDVDRVVTQFAEAGLVMFSEEA
jgi:hypothetical protein